MARQNTLRVTLTDDELFRLEEMRPSGTSRQPSSALLREPPRSDEIATRSEALSILSGLAREGRVAAAIAIERALRDEAPVGDELDEILGAK